MSKDKNKSEQRQRELLTKIAKVKDGKFYLNCEGGMAADNPELLKLARRGYVRIERTDGIPKWTKRFSERPYHAHATPHIRRTYAEITRMGECHLEG